MYPVSDTLTIRSKHSFPKIHLQAADYMAGLPRTEEQKPSSEFDHALHRTSVIGAIMFSVATAEAAVNEVFVDAGEQIPRDPEGALDPEVLDSLAAKWRERRFPFRPMFEKVDEALAIAGAETLDRGRAPHQTAALVVKLRNALVHAEPVRTALWSDDNGLARDEQQLERILEGRFELNPHTGPSNPFFPDHCLSAGCARWAIQVILAYLDAFFDRLGMKPPYAPTQGGP